MYRLRLPLLILGLLTLMATETSAQASASEPDKKIQVLRKLRQIGRRLRQRPARNRRVEIADDTQELRNVPDDNVIVVGSLSMPIVDSDSNIPILDAIPFSSNGLRSATKLAIPSTGRVIIGGVTPRIIIAEEEEEPLGIDVP